MKKLVAYPIIQINPPIIATETKEHIQQTPWGEMGLFCLAKPSSPSRPRANQDRIICSQDLSRITLIDGISDSKTTEVYAFLDLLTQELIDEKNLDIVSKKAKHHLHTKKIYEGLACLAIATLSQRSEQNPPTPITTRFNVETQLTNNQIRKFKHFLACELKTEVEFQGGTLPAFFNGKNEFYKDIRTLHIQTVQDCLDVLTVFECNHNERNKIDKTLSVSSCSLSEKVTVHLEPGDTLLLCSDGISDNLDLGQLGEVIAGTSTVKDTLAKIQEIVSGREAIEHLFLSWKEPTCDPKKPIRTAIHYGAPPFNESYTLENGTQLVPITQPKLDDKSLVLIRIDTPCSVDIVNVGDCEAVVYKADGSIRFKAETHSKSSYWRKGAEEVLAHLIHA